MFPDDLPGRLEVMRGILVETITEVRTLSHSVHPRVLDDLGLASALETLARRTHEGTTLLVRVSTDVQVIVPPPVASVLYRVAQEAARNAVRHSDARELRIVLSVSANSALLEVCDDGKGFDVATTLSSGQGMGLFLMRERLALVGGRLELNGDAAPGTRVRASVPFNTLGAMLPDNSGEPIVVEAKLN